SPGTNFFTDMSFVNKDTCLLADDEPLIGGLFRSTDGCQTWQNLFYQFNYNPDRIYMINKNLGFMSCDIKYSARTTNGGMNWQITPDDSAFRYIAFADSLNGWKTYVNVEKTTDGGLSWSYQQLPNIPGASYNEKVITDIAVINKDTVFAAGGAFRPNPQSQYKCLVYKSTNGGLNWGYQIPDTNYNVQKLYYISFIGKNKGWAFQSTSKFIYTTIGGDDTTYYTVIHNQSVILPDDFVLYQNYPNPFNQSTIINYQLLISGNTTIKIFDITGKETVVLLNKRQSAGRYQIYFDAKNLPSGIYFYTLELSGNGLANISRETKKMILIK
ncbi:MAG: T9SS type A sorting domain-containing protein, partial [Ignavibacteria bacterium]|nr:T9SS type A sorting domain-containing protein [Ignavibacteria bacterium]